MKVKTSVHKAWPSIGKYRCIGVFPIENRLKLFSIIYKSSTGFSQMILHPKALDMINNFYKSYSTKESINIYLTDVWMCIPLNSKEKVVLVHNKNRFTDKQLHELPYSKPKQHEAPKWSCLFFCRHRRHELCW